MPKAFYYAILFHSENKHSALKSDSPAIIRQDGELLTIKLNKQLYEASIIGRSGE
jgi:hypothetical protein